MTAMPMDRFQLHATKTLGQTMGPLLRNPPHAKQLLHVCQRQMATIDSDLINTAKHHLSNTAWQHGNDSTQNGSHRSAK